MPVIYLSLKRLFPIGEDDKLKEDGALALSKEEFEFYHDWHNRILILTKAEDKLVSSDVLSS